MNSAYDYRQFAVLFVDDEEQALKYFHKSFEKDFRTFTASSVQEAMQILETTDDIGVVITDQRMPGKTGVDLLGELRQNRPKIIRILTTAYSDLDSAIEAVNSGAIYKYITKPWNVRDVRGILLRALEFFIVQRERDALFREKLSVIQRLIITDRIRSLAYLAAGLSHHIRNSMQALTTFLDLAPDRFKEDWPDMMDKHPEFWQDMWKLAQEESERILRMVHKVADTVSVPVSSFNDQVDLATVVKTVSEQVAGETQSKPLVDVDASLSPFLTDNGRIERLIGILLRQCIRLSPRGAPIRLVAKSIPSVGGTSGASIQFIATGPDWEDSRLVSLFTAFVPGEDDPRDLGLDLLAAFFITHHHSGDLCVHKSAPDGPGFELHLPFDPRNAGRPPLQGDLLERLFLHFELVS
jgi:two-component system, probable response regulator PhcQ